MVYFSKKSKKSLRGKKKLASPTSTISPTVESTETTTDTTDQFSQSESLSSSTEDNEETMKSNGVEITLTPLPTTDKIEYGFKLLGKNAKLDGGGGIVGSVPLFKRTKNKTAINASSTTNDNKAMKTKKSAKPTDVNFTKIIELANKPPSSTATTTAAATAKEEEANESKQITHTIPLTILEQGNEAVKNYRKKVRRDTRKSNADGDTSNESSVDVKEVKEAEEVEIVFVNEGEKIKKRKTTPDREEEAKEAKKTPKKKDYPKLNDILKTENTLKLNQIEQAKQKRRDDYAKQHKLQQYPEPSEAEKEQYVALDCEMVGIGPTGRASALARVSITNWYGATLLDTMVKVDERVTDFRTHVSGVRSKDIKGSGAMTLKEVQYKVHELTKNKFLVGHALKNDFKVLFLSHPKNFIRDTAAYAPYMRPSGRAGGKMKPRKLRDITLQFLGQKIQVEGESHSSVDDAKAAMDLYIHERGGWEHGLLGKMKGFKVKKGKKGGEEELRMEEVDEEVDEMYMSD